MFDKALDPFAAIEPFSDGRKTSIGFDIKKALAFRQSAEFRAASPDDLVIQSGNGFRIAKKPDISKAVTAKDPLTNLTETGI